MVQQDHTRLAERSHVGAGLETHEPLHWKAVWRVEKYHTPTPGDVARLERGELRPYEVIDRVGNLALLGGVSSIWQTLIGNGTAAAGQALSYFSNANAYIGVGSVTTSAVNTQTRLQDASAAYGTMDSTYPQHTDGTTAATAGTITYRATFGTALANFSWQEWGVSNGTATASRFLNRKVEDLGSKTSAASWVFTVNLSLS